MRRCPPRSFQPRERCMNYADKPEQIVDNKVRAQEKALEKRHDDSSKHTQRKRFGRPRSSLLSNF